MTDDQKVAAGAGPDVVRLSVGIEDKADIIADLKPQTTAGGLIRPSFRSAQITWLANSHAESPRAHYACTISPT